MTLSLLGLPVDSSPAELKEAYRRLARQHHPDHGGTAEKFAALSEEYRRQLAVAMDASCPQCLGRGQIVTTGQNFSTLELRCVVCEGTGKRWPGQQ